MGSKAIEKKNLLPFVLVTSLFALWGLANNMTDTLLAAFRKIMQMSDTETSFIQMAFYGAYFCLALPAARYIKKHSFKGGVILGLSLYALGAIMFLPAAGAANYFFYLMAIYIMASGCCVLETAANPYIMSMGSPETATRRLNIAQSFNPIGSIMGILLSKFYILQNISFYSISQTYAALGCVMFAIMVVMLIVGMPGGRVRKKQDSLSEVFSRLFANKEYVWGVVAQFFYVGAQTGVWSFTIRLVMKELDMVEAQAATLYLISIIGFCVSRLVYSWLMKYVSPKRLLAVGSILSAISVLVVVFSSGWLCVVSLILVSIFMSLMFPTIFGIALGSVADSECVDDSKIGASGLIMAIMGGAVITPLQGLVSDAAGVNWSYCVPFVCFVVVMYYALRNKGITLRSGC